MSRWFVEHDGSPRAAAELDTWLRLRPDDLGPVGVEHLAGVDRGALVRSGVLFCVLPMALGGVVVGLIVAVAVTGSSGAGAGILAGAAVLAVALCCGVLVLGIHVVVVTASVRPVRLVIRAHG